MSAEIYRKVLVVGDKDSGKTALLAQLVQNQCNDYGETAPQVEASCTVKLDVFLRGEKRKILIQNMDDSDYDCPEKYSNSDVIIMCFSIDSPSTLKNITEKWHPQMERLCPGAHVILVGNKKDARDTLLAKLNNMETVNEESGRGVAKKIEASAYRECSTAYNEGISEVFKLAVAVTIPKEKEKKKSLNLSGIFGRKKHGYNKLE